MNYYFIPSITPLCTMLICIIVMCFKLKVQLELNLFTSGLSKNIRCKKPYIEIAYTETYIFTYITIQFDYTTLVLHLFIFYIIFDKR